jgi:hypothetical protein
MKPILLLTLASVFVLMVSVMPLSPLLASQRNLPLNQTYIPGVTYWGRNNYIEYIAGDLPVIISAPHGGYLTPAEISNRRHGIKHIDYRSQEYAREVAAYLKQLTGKQPHLIINHLHRIKLDANRPLQEAAEGNQWAEQAWHEFHDFIEGAEATVTTQCGKGVYLDFHSGSHDSPEVMVELGYGLNSTALARSDEQLNDRKYKDRAMVKSLAYSPGIYFPEIIRGPTSLGGLLQERNFPTVPSPGHPQALEAGYFYSGYNTYLHGSRLGGSIDGIQVETTSWILGDRDRPAYSLALAQSIRNIYEMHYPCLDPPPPTPPPGPLSDGYNLFLPIITDN